MNKILLAWIFSLSSLYALSGIDVYSHNCASCHVLQRGDSTAIMKAPPMAVISKRLKMVKKREGFIVFVNDYIQNPSKEKGYCIAKAYDRFGVMPAIGKKMSEEERKLVSTWLYDNFESNGDMYTGEGAQKNCDSKQCCKEGNK